MAGRIALTGCLAALVAIGAAMVVSCAHSRGLEPIPTQQIKYCSLVVRDERRNLEIVQPARVPDSDFLVAVGAEKKSAAHYAPIFFKVDGDKVEVKGLQRGHTGSIERSSGRVTLRHVASQILDASEQKIVYNGICAGAGGATDTYDRCVDYEFVRGPGLSYRTRGLIDDLFIDFVQCGDRFDQLPPELLIVLDIYLLRLPAVSAAGGLEMSPSTTRIPIQ